MPRLLGDADLQHLLPMERALTLVRAALVEHAQGRLVAPARVAADVGGASLTFTCGAVPGHWVGYRSYLAPGDTVDEQVVVVQDARGRVRAVYVGHDLGPRRTGAIGGVAVAALTPPGPLRVGLIGSGRQAWQQVVAVAAARDVQQLRVWSPTPAHAAALAGRARDELGLEATAALSARDAVEGMAVVILATSSPRPVVEMPWLEGASLVSTLGPKQVGRHEFPLDLAALGGPVVTDSVAQVRAYDPPFVLAEALDDRLLSLGDAVTAGLPEPGRPGRPAVFFSVGLAGTEAFLLHGVLSAADSGG